MPPHSHGRVGDALWHADFWAPSIIKSDLESQHLWALDREGGRICLLERAIDDSL